MKKIITMSVLLVISSLAFGQLNPMGSIYYQNQYLANPAMAGLAKGWELNAAYKSQWSAIDGAPNTQIVSAAYGSENNKLGLGLMLFNDKAGIVNTTSLKATYAYHLPLNTGTTFLDFGLSVGLLDEWANRSEVVGDFTDIAIGNFNARKVYLDADFGFAIRSKGLTFQGAVPNLKRFLDRDIKRNIADRSLFLMALSYKFYSEKSNVPTIEPKIAYRAIENYKNIIDAGVNVAFGTDKIMLSSIYHSSGSVTFGAGTTYKSKLAILAQYTTNTDDLSSYSNGEAEIALRYNFK